MIKRRIARIEHFTLAACTVGLVAGAEMACNVAPVPGGNGGADGAGTGKVTVSLSAAFGDAGFANAGAPSAMVLCPPTPTPTDLPEYQGEQDCDGDGGIVRYVTPSAYQIAVKRLAFQDASGNLVDVIPDSGTLVNAQVLDLTSGFTLADLSLPAGDYPNYYAEIYYHEISMPLYDPVTPQAIRVYVSDDDFPSEGRLGHHQGDITLIAAGGTEQGFVPAGDVWQVASLQAARGTINGIGGADAETGHLRGLYGDADLWNRPSAVQGPGQDIFILEGDLGLTLAQTESTVTFSFDVQDAWFFEDFDNDQWFNPCEGGTLDGCGGEWSPVFSDPEVSVE